MEDFDSMAVDFDTDRRKTRAKAVADEIRKHIVKGERKSAMEFGCGTGLVGIELIDDFRSLLFMDPSEAMIAQVKRKLDLLSNETASAICCDIMNSPPYDLQVDTIFGSLVLHHIVDTEAILARFYQLLNNDGCLLIIDLDKDDGSFHAKYPDFHGHNGYEQSTLANLARRVGFGQIHIETFYHNTKMVNGENKPYSLFIMSAIKER